MEALREVYRRRSEFLATLAHELRNPLAPIRNALQLLRLSSDKPEMLERLRGTMERQVDQMVHLINDLLDIARISSGKMDLQIRLIDLQTVIANAIETSLPLIEAGGHQLKLDLPAEPIWANGDAVRLSQVLTNLLSNASKYTPESGRISVSAHTSGDMAVIKVSDRGIGIAEQDLGRVFDMFSQASHSIAISKGGLGIGLSLVRQIVTLHGGTVNAFSAGRGHGSTFTIRLPLATYSAEETSGPSAPAAVVYPSRDPSLKILVADDNVDAAETLSLLLREQGHEVRVAYDGEEAVLVGKSFVPDVAILDLGMPLMDGCEVAGALSALLELEHVRLVALSGWGAPEDQARTKAAGFDYHLLKPVDIKTLMSILTVIRKP